MDTTAPTLNTGFSVGEKLVAGMPRAVYSYGNQAHENGNIVKIQLNGKEFEVADDSTLANLIDALGFTGQRVAVLLDDQVVRKAQYSETRLNPGSRVEMIQMVGGG
jgi:sulfur carrier protein